MNLSRENMIIAGGSLAIGLIVGSVVTKFAARLRFRKINKAVDELEAKLSELVPAE